ncbi:MAG TPA: hypothetical protein VFF40_12165 [Acidimicrobiia bacterium]|nr:hypothetical protein [Acidimicrobiia bacterium]
MLKVLRRLLVLGALAAIAVAVYRKVSAGQSAGAWNEPLTTPPHEAPTDETPSPDQTPSPDETPASWVEPEGTSCPASHPVKAKLSSGIFHLPGGTNYERTNADRCYIDPDAAAADGLRAAKR